MTTLQSNRTGENQRENLMDDILNKKRKSLIVSYKGRVQYRYLRGRRGELGKNTEIIENELQQVTSITIVSKRNRGTSMMLAE